MRKTLTALSYLVYVGPAIVIFGVLVILLGGDARAALVVILVILGTVFAELTEIAGARRPASYHWGKRPAANNPESRWVVFRRVIGEYKQDFQKMFPRFCFRMLSWALLSVAGVVLVKILGF